MRRAVASLTLMVTVAVAAFGCAALGYGGMAARETITVPAIAQSWPPIAVDIRASAPASIESVLTVWDQAIAEGDQLMLVALRSDWPTLRGYALETIVARQITDEIGPGVAASMEERLRLFGVGLMALDPYGDGEPTDPDLLGGG